MIRIMRGGLCALTLGTHIYLVSGLFAFAHAVEKNAVSADAPLLVELFTSQACATCPPADMLFKELIRQPGIIGLSMSVNYWDYLGWKDTLASRSNVRRQKFYVNRFDKTQVYTPQLVVGGITEAVGSNRQAVKQAVAKARKMRGPQVEINARLIGNQLNINIGALQPAPAGVHTVWMIYADDEVSVPINRGENGGRTLTYAHVVREHAAIGAWSGKPLNLSIPVAEMLASGYDLCVIVVQPAKGGPIIGTTQLSLHRS